MIFRFSSKIRYAKRSPKWSSIRKDFLDKNSSCAACGRTKKLEVHHIVPVHVDPLRELDDTNLITLCDSPCHLLFGHLLDYKSWNTEVISDTKNYLEKINKRPYHETR